jgi:hypothetical protein
MLVARPRYWHTTRVSNGARMNSQPRRCTEILVDPTARAERSLNWADLRATLWPKSLGPMTNAVVRARINEQVKREAAEVLAEIGLTVSHAFRLMVRIARDKALPFAPLIVAARKRSRP